MQATPPEPPPAIVVTAPALPNPAAERAYSIVVLSREHLANAPSTQLDQLLKEVPGLQLFRRSDARSSHPTSQGVTLRGLGGSASSRATLTLDSVPQTDPFGGWVNWPAYDPASLSEVRVIRGGGSVANGPGALAGTIEMRSRRDGGFTASVEAGSRGAWAGRLFGGVTTAGGTLAVSAAGARGDGFNPVTADTRGPADMPAPYRQASVRALWTAPLGATTIELSGLAFTDRRERGVAFTGNRTDGADAAIRLAGDGRWGWTALGYGQTRELRSSFASVSEGRAAASRVSLQDSVPSHSLGASFEVRPPVGQHLQLRIGGDTRRSQGESREFYSYVAAEPTRRRRAGGSLLTAGLFGEGTGSLGALAISVGGRIDRWHIGEGELFEQMIVTGVPITQASYPVRSGWLPTARASAVFDVGRGWNLTSAAYLGWRPPTLNELFRPFRAGADATAANPLLDPERLAGAEVGMRYVSDGFSLSATAFGNRLKNAIANVTLGHGPGVFPGVGFVAGEYRQRRNIGAVRVHGIELSGELRHGPVTASAGASLTDARVDGGGAAPVLDGLRPAQTPKLGLSGGLAWAEAGRAASLLLRHVGGQYEDDLNVDRLPAATTFDAFVAWPLARSVQIFARGENLTNKRVVAGVGGDGSIERATPRSLSIGIRFQSTRGTP